MYIISYFSSALPIRSDRPILSLIRTILELFCDDQVSFRFDLLSSTSLMAMVKSVRNCSFKDSVNDHLNNSLFLRLGHIPFW